MHISRRRFLAGAGAAGLAVAARNLPLAGAAAPSVGLAAKLPDPNSSGLDHIVVLCMENRSFDHYLGWVPGADGKQAGLSYADDDGKRHATHRLEEGHGCGFN